VSLIDLLLELSQSESKARPLQFLQPQLDIPLQLVPESVQMRMSTAVPPTVVADSLPQQALHFAEAVLPWNV
jgi:hypothetical protein